MKKIKVTFICKHFNTFNILTLKSQIPVANKCFGMNYPENTFVSLYHFACTDQCLFINFTVWPASCGKDVMQVLTYLHKACSLATLALKQFCFAVNLKVDIGINEKTNAPMNLD